MNTVLIGWFAAACLFVGMLVMLEVGRQFGARAFAVDHEAKNGISKELKALIAGRNRLALDCRRMRKGRAQQHLIVELVAQDFLGARKSVG